MIHCILFTLCLGGFILLLSAMVRHQQDWLRRKLSPVRSATLRRCGFLSLALAYVAAGAGLGWAYGTVVWCGWLTVAAALTVTLNVNRERILAKVRA